MAPPMMQLMTGPLVKSVVRLVRLWFVRRTEVDGKSVISTDTRLNVTVSVENTPEGKVASK